jgi:hypothetical protein
MCGMVNQTPLFRAEVRRMRCERLDPSLLGESWDQVHRTSTSPTLACAHELLPCVQAICQTRPMASRSNTTMFAVSSFATVPRLRHCPRQGMPVADRVIGTYWKYKVKEGPIGKLAALIDFLYAD